VILKVLFAWLYPPGTPHGISNMVTPTAARMIQRTTPQKLAIRDLLATTSRSPALPEKTQNVTKPKMGIKKLRMYTNHLDEPIIHLLEYPIFFSTIPKAASLIPKQPRHRLSSCP